MSDQDYAVMAHLLRRAGFGATRDELDEYVAKGYEATVEELLHPGDPQNMPDDLIQRYHVDMHELRGAGSAYWLYRIVTTECPLEEKIALFWHGLLATGYSKINQQKSVLNQIDMFRRYGLGRFPDLLVELSKDPAMIVWLDNNDNHNGTINENYGRELLELFSMGIGNYSEDDIKECARAFTGWTLGNVEYMTMRASKDSIWPYGRIAWHFDYRDYDHDGDQKTFLGETGDLNGEDVIDIIARQEATAHFVSTRLFQFFVADDVDEDGEAVVQEMMRTYFDSGYEIRDVLRTLFNSGYFKSALYKRVKSPAELVGGTLRLAGEFKQPSLDIHEPAAEMGYMGQAILNPPTVEGWHEGTEWIDSGALIERVNFAAKHLGNTENPGVRSIIDRLAAMDGGVLSPEQLVDGCLDLVGPISVSESTRLRLIAHASRGGDIDLGSRQPGDESEQTVADVLKLIASSREYQLA